MGISDGYIHIFYIYLYIYTYTDQSSGQRPKQNKHFSNVKYENTAFQLPVSGRICEIKIKSSFDKVEYIKIKRFCVTKIKR